MLKEVKDYLKTLNAADTYSVGVIDSTRLKTLGIYSSGPAPRVEAIGENSSYRIAEISLLLHWNKNAVETEEAARALWGKLENLAHFKMGTIDVDYLDLQYGEPVAMGPDDNGIYEYVINFNIYYKRS